MSSGFFTIAEVAKRYGVAPNTIRKEIDEGILPAMKVRGQYRISAADLTKYEEHCRARAARRAASDSCELTGPKPPPSAPLFKKLHTEKLRRAWGERAN